MGNRQSTREYEKPTILKVGHPSYLKGGASNKGYLHLRSDIEGISLSDLVGEYGSPLFVFSEKSIREKIKAAKAAFNAKYPKVTFAWSYKTNYLKGICSLFHQEGFIAEVVSDFEYEKARNLGVEGHQIIYNGPYKPSESLKRAIREKARIHLDNFEELLEMERLAKEMKVKVPVGLRVNLNSGPYLQWTRFGLNYESGQAYEAAKYICSSKHLSLTGIHTHIGTFILDPLCYQVAAEKMAQFLNEIERDFQVRVQYLDMGGGLASKHSLKGVYQAPEVVVPSVKEYADKITGALKKNLPENYRPELILEAGRHLVDEAGFLICTVVAHKLLPDGRRSYVLDGGTNLLYTSTWYQFKVELDGREDGLACPSLLNGPLCMNIDVVHEGLMLPSLKVGKRLVLSPVGAYNVTQWMQFIQLRPAVVMVGKDKKIHRLRKKEDLAHLEEYEELPPHLDFRKK